MAEITTVVPRMSQRLKILAKCRFTDSGCWEWTGYRLPDGYGQMAYLRKMKLAHRISYMLFRGPIPDGLELDHLCRNTGCVNPDHLEAVSASVNARRGKTIAAFNAQKTHCKSGHEFSPANTYLRGGKYRQCKACLATCRRKARANG